MIYLCAANEQKVLEIMEEKKNKHEYHQEMHSLGCNKKKIIEKNGFVLLTRFSVSFGIIACFFCSINQASEVIAELCHLMIEQVAAFIR